jgi:signal transduction histidine kinase/CheY-like chemotaxis protein
VHVPGADSLLPIAARSTPALPYAHNSVTVDYGTPSLAQPSAIEYQYRVPRRSSGWSDWTRRTERELQNLSPGTVAFAVRARTAYGDTTRAARVSFTVRPPWYRTWWAYGGYVLLALGLVGGAVQWRTRQLRRRQEALEETVAERTEQIRRKNDELARQAEKLRELDEAKSRFFANLSHEFRTPLTLIRGPVQEVREHLARANGDREDEADQLALVERNVDRLRRLVDQLLALARMDAGTYELAARPTELGVQVQRIVRAFAPLAEQNDLTLTVETDDAASDEAAPVVVDREALEHILGNLLSNAIKFTPGGGRVTVTVTHAADHADLTVADTGPGIPEAQQEAVFDRFQQADENTPGDREGVGIGLAFTKDLVDLHGGSVTLDSTEGEGTTITVRFPLGTDHLTEEHLAQDPEPPSAEGEPVDGAEPAPEGAANGTDAATLASPSAPSAERTPAPDATPPPDDQSERGSNDQSKIVLIVDDNADVRRYVRSVLVPTYTVIEAADGEEGLARAREAAPDCILADVMMPGMDGVAMVRRLKSDRATDHIPVVMLTARAGTEHEIEGLEAGADDYVTKPFDADVLRARVAGMIEVRRRLRRRIREELRRRRGDGSAAAERPDGDGPVEDRSGGDQTRDTAPPRLVVPTAAENEPDFVREVRAAIEERLADPDLSVEQLAGDVAVSRSTLYRRLKEQADATPSQFVRRVRVEHGARLLREGEGTVSEVAYAVGFESLSYFSRQFREQFGQSPSEYVEAIG